MLTPIPMIVSMIKACEWDKSADKIWSMVQKALCTIVMV